ncbi:response regulator [Pseudahrensia aquimaris]|uniref:Response regulator n=1 Tax=Pseudahrensia aquimaris TaxID=744461 RepID=A0ABW3F8N4_9HYPH
MVDRRSIILVIDDDEKVRKVLRRALEVDGYRIIEASNAEEALLVLAENEVDLVTLDLQLGAENGLDIAARIREKSDVPIIMVTGKSDVLDKVVGLEMGADDYISKPFHVRELQARVRSMLRRQARVRSTNVDADINSASHANLYSFDGWTADADSFLLTAPDGSECELTTTDFKLLLLFLNAPKRILSRDQIMDQLNGQEWTPLDRTVDNQVARLRKKIESDPSHPKIIKTVRGTGYIFAAAVKRS